MLIVLAKWCNIKKRQNSSTLLLLTSEENAVLAEMTRAVTHSEIFIQGKSGGRGRLVALRKSG